MAISAAKQAFLDALAGVKQKIDTGDDTFSETEMAAVTESGKSEGRRRYRWSYHSGCRARYKSSGAYGERCRHR